MVDFPNSPRGSTTLVFEDKESKRRSNTSTFDIFRFVSTQSFTSSNRLQNDVSLHNNVLSFSDPIRPLKIKVIRYNPMIYNMLRQYLVEQQCYTDITICNKLNHFIDTFIRIPEFRMDILNHPLARDSLRHVTKMNSTITGSSIFAYLTGESLSPSATTPVSYNSSPLSISSKSSSTQQASPILPERPNVTTNQTPRSKTTGSFSSNRSVSTTSITSMHSRELSLPSLL